MTMDKPDKLVITVRRSTAVLWLVSALFASPLAFGRLTGNPVPLYGVAEAVTLPVLAVLAAAILVWCGGIVELYRERSWQIFGAAQVLLLAVAAGHWAGGNMNGSGVGMTLFWVLAPTVGAVLKAEFKLILPVAAAVTALLLAVSGFTSEYFTGLTGNWNWTQGVLFALLPGGFFLLKKYCRWWKYVAIAAVMLMMAVIYGIYPKQFSYGALAAVAAAVMVLLIKILAPEIWQRRCFIGGAIGAAAGFAAVLSYADFANSRLQLWKGAWAMFGSEIWTGFGQVGNRILEFLPEKYYFTPHAAVWHPHPHNEVLNFLCYYGIAGGIFLAVLLFAVLRRPVNDDRDKLALWIFAVLFGCAQFDMHCAVVIGALWALTCAGIVAAPAPAAPSAAIPLWRHVAGIALLIAACGMTLNHYRAGAARRQGELAILKGDTAGAGAHWRRSLKYEKTPHTLYMLAEQELLAGRVHYARILLEELQRQKLENYCHARRLRGMCEFQLGNYDAALENMRAECRNYPFSIISARFKWQMLSACRAPDAPEAGEIFYALCYMRRIPVQDAANLTPAADDKPLKDPAP
ncbi:MAG: O-antigen ligase family protein [Lentisphaeria bacterium]|nr:O-antigen ligase family protein [Lentisphaeria bacterium]